jgi:hypothetical protein
MIFLKSLRSSFCLTALTFFSCVALGDEVHQSTAGKTPIFGWPEKKLTWLYSDLKEPAWLNPGEGLILFKEAAHSWKDCGVEITFKGPSETPPRKNDGVNTFGWITVPSGLRGLTSRKIIPGTTEIKETDIVINALNPQLKNDRLLLAKVVKHELGHALGLFHAKGCADIMSSAAECGSEIANPPPIAPTLSDLEQCDTLYRPALK